MARALGLDLLTRVRNIRWKTGEQFLYSGDDGMFGSSDGERWTVAPSSVPAQSLAFIDGAWIACSSVAGPWRSVDGARTWASIAAPMFVQVVAFRPAGVAESGGPKQGVFVAWVEDEEGEHDNVYASHDLGKTWSLVHSIGTSVSGGGFERIRILSGCGSRAFVSTVRSEGESWASAGHIYSSTDGHSFSGGMVFGPPTFNPPGPYTERKSYTAGGIGFDGKRYAAVGLREHYPSSSTRIDTLSYIESSDGSFGTPEEGTAFVEANSSDGVGQIFTGTASMAGGDNVFATSSLRLELTPSITGGQISTHFIPGGSTTQLLTVGPDLISFIGSFCKKPSGVFACAAYGADRAGGVYIARANSTFRKTHSGTGFPTGMAVAVGRIGFPLGDT